MKLHCEVISPRRRFTEQTPDVTVPEVRQLIPGINMMRLLDGGDVCFSKSGGSSLPEKPQKMHLSSWVHRLDWHGQNHLPLKNGKGCTEVTVKTSVESDFSPVVISC